MDKKTLLNNIGYVCAEFKDNKRVLWGGRYITNYNLLCNMILQKAKADGYKISITEIKQATEIRQMKDTLERLKRGGVNMENIFIRLTPSQAMELKEVENIVGIDYDMGLTSIEVGNLLQMVIDLKEKYEDTKEEYEEKISDMKEEFEEYVEYHRHI